MILKQLSKPDRKFAADITHGMLASGSCLLTDVADQLHESSKKTNTIDRLSKHLMKGLPAKQLLLISKPSGNGLRPNQSFTLMIAML